LFEYAKKIAVENDAVDIVHEYRCTGSYVEPGDLSGFVSKHDKIRAELVSIMIDPQSVAANGRMNWIMVACYVAAVIASVWAARRIYVRYDPEPRAPVGDGVVPRLGGWLLLPAFAIIVALCREVYDLSQLPQVFDSGIHSWFSATHHVLFMLLMMVDACRMVTGVLLAFTFFHRRSSAPFIFIAYIAVTWIVALGTKGLMGEGTGEEVSQTAPAYFMLAMIAAAWVAYFIRSDRVKRTFVARGPLHARRDPISDPFASFIE
jgi:hypothetical protein